jgi:hypothetical protein
MKRTAVFKCAPSEPFEKLFPRSLTAHGIFFLKDLDSQFLRPSNYGIAYPSDARKTDTQNTLTV